MDKGQGQKDKSGSQQSASKVDQGVEPIPLQNQPAAALQRLMTTTPPLINPSDIMTMQQTVGNRKIRQFLLQRFQDPTTATSPGVEVLNQASHPIQPFPALQRDQTPPASATRPGRARSEQITRDFDMYRTSTMSGYVRAVQALEAAYPQYNPRQILAMLRQVYYGRPWSTSPTEQWREVLPQSPDMPDPRSGGARGLYYALQQSTIIDGIDIGHVLTGMEAVLNPMQQVELEIPGPNYVVNMPNTEFATWGGDLGSAAGQACADQDTQPPARADRDYFQDLASDADLLGDIDAFVMQRGARGSGGLAGMLQGTGPPASGTPVSEILRQFYLTSGTPMGRARTNRYNEFASSIGGRISGRTITNRAQLAGPIAIRVASFARLWYAKEIRNASMPGVGAARAAQILHAPGTALYLRLFSKSLVMVNLFLDWLQARL